VAEAAEEARRLNERRDVAVELLRAVFEECDDAEFARRLEALRDAETDEPEARLGELEIEEAALEAELKRLEETHFLTATIYQVSRFLQALLQWDIMHFI
jgi:hypothetical protein